MSGRSNGTDRVPVASRLGDGLETVMFGRYARAYAWFVRGLLASFLVAAVVYLGRRTVLVFTPETAAIVDTVISVVFASFVLVAALQAVVLVRRVRRGQETVTASAEQLEETADEVADAAERVAELSTAVRDGHERDANRVERTAEAVKRRAEHAGETADAVGDELTEAKPNVADEVSRNGENEPTGSGEK